MGYFVSILSFDSIAHKYSNEMLSWKSFNDNCHGDFFWWKVFEDKYKWTWANSAMHIERKFWISFYTWAISFMDKFIDYFFAGIFFVGHRSVCWWIKRFLWPLDNRHLRWFSQLSLNKLKFSSNWTELQSSSIKLTNK